MKESGWGTYDHSWAEYHGFTNTQDLNDIISDMAWQDPKYDAYFPILHAKKAKLWGKIHFIIEECIAHLQSDFDNISWAPELIKFKYDITSKTYHKMAIEALKWINLHAIEFDDFSIKNSTISYTNGAFIDPTQYEQLSQFHDQTDNEDRIHDNRYEIYSVILEPHIPNEVTLALNELGNSLTPDHLPPEFKEYQKIIEKNDLWEI